MKKANRWVFVVVGIAVLLLDGLVYAWSVLAQPISREFPQWTKTELSLTFTIMMIFFCAGCITGGLLTGKVKPRLYLWSASILFLCGFLGAARMTSLTELYISFGVICGFASGLAYNAVMGTVCKWFPDRQGIVSGILLMAFGMSSFLVGKLYQACTPDSLGAWRQSFVVMGLITAVVLAVCAFWIKRPEHTVQSIARPSASGADDMPTSQMLHRPAFCIYYIWASILSAAGLALVSQASGITQEVVHESSVSMFATLVGLISVFNGIGRVAAGAFYDKSGRRWTMRMVNTAFLVAGGALLLAVHYKSCLLLVLGFAFGGMAYGGVPSTNSAFVSSSYGEKYYPMNFAVMNTTLIPASFGSTIAGALYDRWQTYEGTYFLIAVVGLIGILLSMAITLCDHQKK